MFVVFWFMSFFKVQLFIRFLVFCPINIYKFFISYLYQLNLFSKKIARVIHFNFLQVYTLYLYKNTNWNLLIFSSKVKRTKGIMILYLERITITLCENHLNNTKHTHQSKHSSQDKQKCSSLRQCCSKIQQAI